MMWDHIARSSSICSFTMQQSDKIMMQRENGISAFFSLYVTTIWLELELVSTRGDVRFLITTLAGTLQGTQKDHKGLVLRGVMVVGMESQSGGSRGLYFPLLLENAEMYFMEQHGWDAWVFCPRLLLLLKVPARRCPTTFCSKKILSAVFETTLRYFP